MSVIVDSKYRGPHDNTERKTLMCDPQHMCRWVIVVSCLSVCVHVHVHVHVTHYHPPNKHQYRANNSLFSLDELKFSKLTQQWGKKTHTASGSCDKHEAMPT